MCIRDRAKKEDLKEVDIYHTVAHREIYLGPMGVLGTYAGTRITGDEDIEHRHNEICSVYKDRLEEGGEWEGADKPLAEIHPSASEVIEAAKKLQEALEKCDNH